MANITGGLVSGFRVEQSSDSTQFNRTIDSASTHVDIDVDIEVAIWIDVDVDVDVDIDVDVDVDIDVDMDDGIPAVTVITGGNSFAAPRRAIIG